MAGPGELIGGALLGAAVSELLKSVIQAIKETASFKPCLKKLRLTLESLKPKVEEIQRMYQIDESPELNKLVMKLEEGKILIEKCSAVKPYNFYLKHKCAEKIIELDDSLIRFFQFDLPLDNWLSNRQNGVKLNNMDQKIDQLRMEKESSSKHNSNGAGVDEDGRKAANKTDPSMLVSHPADHLKTDTAKASENLECDTENTAPTASIDSVVAEPEVSFFMDDTSAAEFFETMITDISKESVGGVAGVGKTNLTEGLNMAFFHGQTCKKSGKMYLFNYKDVQFVVVRKHLFSRPGLTLDQVEREHHRHMEFVARVRQENVAPLRAFYYSFRYPAGMDLPHQDRHGEHGVKMLLVYDYYRNGSVFEMLHGNKEVPLDWDVRLRVAIGVARGIAFIHKQDNGKLFHGNIKSTNVFLNTANYGCISDLGKCVGGYPDPDVTTCGGRSCQGADIYYCGVLLLELVTGNTPFYPPGGFESDLKLVKEFIGSSEQLRSKVAHFIRLKQQNPEALGFQVLDRELAEHHQESKEQFIQMLLVALYCVSERAPKIDDVVNMLEGTAETNEKLYRLTGSTAPTASIITSVAAHQRKVDSVKANEKFDRHAGSRAPTPSIKTAVAAPEVPVFRDDKTTANFFKTYITDTWITDLTKEPVDGVACVGKTSLPEGLDLSVLYRQSEKIGDVSNDGGKAKLYVEKDVQLVLVRKILYSRPGQTLSQAEREHHRHMELVGKVRQENVAPLRAFHYSFYLPSGMGHRHRGRHGVLMFLVYDYYRKGSVFEMLHGNIEVPLDWDARLRIATGVAKGIAFIHKQDDGKLFHGRIKSTNIFLNTKNYGCISDLGKCVGGYPDPDITTCGGRSCQGADIYYYGVLLLELVTGNTPFYAWHGFESELKLVKEFKEFIGSSEQLDSKVTEFIRLKQGNREEVGFQVLDRELLKHHREFKGQFVRMLLVALYCVSERAPKIDDVVNTLEDKFSFFLVSPIYRSLFS